ncbi:MAG: GTPase ObgE, partial [Campylobacterota bacterium]|nr:GTPase ObgE [Campylobacterota bacterium]
KFAIALTKIDAIDQEELNEKCEAFIASLELEISKENSFGFDKQKVYYVQDLTFEKYNNELPYFILPISSPMHTNTSAITYALYDLLEQE